MACAMQLARIEKFLPTALGRKFPPFLFECLPYPGITWESEELPFPTASNCPCNQLATVTSIPVDEASISTNLD